jgi:serine/threonine protein kinase
MNCPSCNSPLEQNARFCGVCGYRLQAKQAAPQARSGGGEPGAAIQPRPNPAPVRPAPAAAAKPPGQIAAGTPKQAPKAAKSRQKSGDEIYINQVLNNRFRVESKIGEGGFGAVYRGVQLATGRKVALKLLHPEMTKDENLVARFEREGRVLCNLRDAHTITTYDFDRTQDGTLYIAMELLEGKSLHQLFHEQAPLDWKRMFKILSEMCSSLAEAHAQGIVHRDLKPENVYLEPRPGNPEFVKILDFGIAKVMRGDTIDPQSPQLTATGQTLGTLEYMSPEQLMGKALDGRSDVYALGVVAYEMITGRLPFPDAKGPAGLITAQLKQTPIPPSAANAKVSIPQQADRVILKCLEKDKNNRYADVTALAAGLQEVLAHASAEHQSLNQSINQSLNQSINQQGSSNPNHRLPAPPELMETRRGDPPPMNNPPAMPPALNQSLNPSINQSINQSMNLHPDSLQPQLMPPQAYPQVPLGMQGSSPNHHVHNYPSPIPGTHQAPSYPLASSMSPYGDSGQQPGLQLQMQQPGRSSKRWIWWVIGLLALGAAAGAAVAVLL